MNKPSSIAQEIKQQRPFRSRRQEAAIALLRTTDLLRRRFEDTSARAGVTLQQFNVLRILRGAGAPLPTMEIGERLIEQAPGVTRLLDRLEEKGLISRSRCTKDRRRVHCEITPAGLDVLRQLDAPMEEVDDCALATLSEPELDTMIQLLDRIRASIPSCPIDDGSEQDHQGRSLG